MKAKVSGGSDVEQTSRGMGVEMLEHVLHGHEGLSRTRWGREMNVAEALHLFQLHLALHNCFCKLTAHGLLLRITKWRLIQPLAVFCFSKPPFQGMTSWKMKRIPRMILGFRGLGVLTERRALLIRIPIRIMILNKGRDFLILLPQ